MTDDVKGCDAIPIISVVLTGVPLLDELYNEKLLQRKNKDNIATTVHMNQLANLAPKVKLIIIAINPDGIINMIIPMG